MAFPEPSSALSAFYQQQKLPDSFHDHAMRWFYPLAARIAETATSGKKPLLVGINGCQGSGKSTLAAWLVEILAQDWQCKAIDLSVDDFYLTHADRQQLAADVHPLLATRGVPGTHDVALMKNTLAQLATPGEVSIPRFNKADDDRFPPDDWPTVEAPVDVILLEGWCMGAIPQVESDLAAPVNDLEALGDADGSWRSYVNQSLVENYQPLFQTVDLWAMLKAPAFETVHRWRVEQENKLKESLAGQGSRFMSEDDIARFIKFYQRITEHSLKVLPERVDFLYRLNEQRQITCLEFPLGDNP
ncbi:MAG: hypothetical protein ACWA5K_06330 [bacterium]